MSFILLNSFHNNEQEQILYLMDSFLQSCRQNYTCSWCFRCSLSGRILVWEKLFSIGSQSNHCPCSRKIANALLLPSVIWLLTGTCAHVVWERKSETAGQAMLFIKQLLSVQQLFCSIEKPFLRVHCQQAFYLKSI